MFLAFDIGGTFVKFAVVDTDGKIIERGKIPTPQTQAPFLEALEEKVEDLQKKFELQGIGISACGTPNAKGEMPNFGALTNLYGLPLGEKLSSLSGLPVVVENDANAAAIAEKWTGAGQNYSDYMVITLGTGVGGGIIINDKIYRGGHGIAGEFGWALTNGITAVGELEDVSQNFKSAAVLGLLNNYNKALLSVTHNQGKALESAKDVVDLVENGDPVASIVFEQFLTDLSVSLMNLSACFDPEMILIGGGISENQFFFDQLKKKWFELIGRHAALSRMKEKNMLTQIGQAQLGNDAGIIGATYLIKQHLEEK